MCSITQSCMTLCDPIDCNLQGSSVHGVLQARMVEWVAIFLLQKTFPTQGSNPQQLLLLHWREIVYHWRHLGSPPLFHGDHKM